MTPHHQDTDPSIESTTTPEQQRTHDRMLFAQNLSAETADLDSAEAYDNYKGLVDSIRESARDGEFTTGAQQEPFTEEQALEQIIAALDVQSGEAKVADGVIGARLLPRSGGLRVTLSGLLGPMAPGSMPTEHRAVLEGLVREAYDEVTHPEAEVLLGVEDTPLDDVDASVGDETLDSAFPERETLEATPEASEDAEEEAPESGEQLPGGEEDAVRAEYESRVRNLSEALTDTLAQTMQGVEQYEHGGDSLRRVLAHVESSLNDMQARVRSFDNYSVEGARTALVAMNDELYALRGGLLRAGVELDEPSGRMRAAEVQMNEAGGWAQQLDGAATAEFTAREMPTDSIESQGAQAIQAVAQDAFDAVAPVREAAQMLQAIPEKSGRELQRAGDELEQSLRQSYMTDRIDSNELTEILRRTAVALQEVTDEAVRLPLRERAQHARDVLVAARQQITDR